MDDRKIIAVIGATGAQGGGLCRAILKDAGGGYRVRAVTRNAGSDKAKELERLGAEVVEADIDDVESLKKAFSGAHGAFCVTFFWEHFSPEKELEEADNMAGAATHAGVRHVIWSTLEDTRKWVPLNDNRMPTLMGKYKVPHFDAKGEADKVFSGLGVPTTFLLTSFYWDNFIYFGIRFLKRVRTANRRSRCQWVTKSFPALPRKISASAVMASLKKAPTSSAKQSALRESS